MIFLWSKFDYFMMYSLIFCLFGGFLFCVGSLKSNLEDVEAKREERKAVEVQQEKEKQEQYLHFEKTFGSKTIKIGDVIHSNEDNQFTLIGMTFTDFKILSKTKNSEPVEYTYPRTVDTFFSLEGTDVYIKVKEYNHENGSISFFINDGSNTTNE